MEKIERDDPRELEASRETPSRAGPEHAAEPFWKKAMNLLSVLGVTGIVGTVVGAYFQERAWNNDKAIAKRQDDASTAFDVEQKVSEFIDNRWAAADQVRAVLQSSAGEEEWKRARDKYSENFGEWQSNLAKWAGQIAFHVDSPFRMPTDDKRKEISAIKCLTYTLDFKLDSGANIDSRSASHLLQIIDHCHDLAKQDIEKINANKRGVKAVASCEKATRTLSETETDICNFATRISHVWWLNNVLRCTILQRAVIIRDSGANSIWEKIVMPQAPSKYDLAQDAPDCVRDYHDNDRFGSAATSGKL
jgi:hypothetical protein